MKISDVFNEPAELNFVQTVSDYLGYTVVPSDCSDVLIMFNEYKGFIRTEIKDSSLTVHDLTNIKANLALMAHMTNVIDQAISLEANKRKELLADINQMLD